MIATKLEFVKRTENNANKWVAILSSETTPTDLNITGADVDNVPDADVFAAGSVLITPSENYYAFEDGVFTLKS